MVAESGEVSCREQQCPAFPSLGELGSFSAAKLGLKS
jgi:hypothetical protein